METQELRELNSVLKNTNLLLSDQMFFHLCTATAVWREGTTPFKKNPHSSSRFNWSLRFSIIFRIKELYSFLCIIEIVLNVSKHMIRKWDLLNEQEIAWQFRQFQWAFFLFFKKKKKERGWGERGRGRWSSSLGCGHWFPDLSLQPFAVLKPRQCLLVLVSDFYHHQVSWGCHSLSGREATGRGGRNSRWLNRLVMQVGDCLLIPTLWKGGGGEPFLQTSHHSNIPPSSTPQPATQGNRFYDLWL